MNRYFGSGLGRQEAVARITYFGRRSESYYIVRVQLTVVVNTGLLGVGPVLL